MPRHGPHLRITQPDIGTFGQTTVAQSHKGHRVLEPGRFADLGESVPEMVQLARQMNLPEAIRLIRRIRRDAAERFAFRK